LRLGFGSVSARFRLGLRSLWYILSCRISSLSDYSPVRVLYLTSRCTYLPSTLNDSIQFITRATVFSLTASVRKLFKLNNWWMRAYTECDRRCLCLSRSSRTVPQSLAIGRVVRYDMQRLSFLFSYITLRCTSHAHPPHYCSLTNNGQKRKSNVVYSENRSTVGR
jgi:hypothetical protein